MAENKPAYSTNAAPAQPSGEALSPDQLAAKIVELENRLDKHDDALSRIITAIGSLIESQPPQQQSDAKKSEIGFHVRELEAHYNFKRRKY